MSLSLAKKFLDLSDEIDRKERDKSNAEHALENAGKEIAKVKDELMKGICDQQPIKIYTWKECRTVVHVTKDGVKLLNSETQ